MDNNDVIDFLKAQRDRLNLAIEALEGNGVGRGKRKRKYRMSAAARRRISLAAKRRWAEKKKAA